MCGQVFKEAIKAAVAYKEHSTDFLDDVMRELEVCIKNFGTVIKAENFQRQWLLLFSQIFLLPQKFIPQNLMVVHAYAVYVQIFEACKFRGCH